MVYDWGRNNTHSYFGFHQDWSGFSVVAGAAPSADVISRAAVMVGVSV